MLARLFQPDFNDINLSQRQVPIVVKLRTDARQDLEQLGRLMVPGVKGPVLLSQVATFEMSGGPAMISRLNRVRNVNFEVELSGVPLGEVTEAVAKLPSIVNLPAGVQQVEIGDAEVQGEMVAGFALAMGTGVLCIYIVLVLLFKDFMHPISVIPAVILSFGGAFMGLLISGKMLSMPSFIGLVMLIGVSDHSQGIWRAASYLADHTGPLLDKLRDPAYFARVFVDAGALCWPNGLELSPARLHALAEVISAV